MALAGELLEKPQPPDLALRGMVQDVHLPDTESDLAVRRGQHLHKE